MKLKKAAYKRIGAILLTSVMTLEMFHQVPSVRVQAETEPVVTQIPGTVKTEKAIDGSFLSVTGFAKGKVNSRAQYKEGDAAYAVVTNETEFFEALQAAKNDEVEVIELRTDLYLGWDELPDDVKEDYDDLIEPYSSSQTLAGAPLANPSMIESGVSCLHPNHIDGLTIFSKTGNKIEHAEIKLNADVTDFVIRNLEITNIWDWDDRRTSGYGNTGALGTTKRVGFSCMKINGAKNIWIDHCNFSAAYDGNIDIENGSSGISITWCNIGNADMSKDGMVYKAAMYMEELYQQNKADSSVGVFLMYQIMRDNGMSIEDIMKYMAHHKKCHLGGGGDSDSWWFDVQTEKLLDAPNPARMNANEYLRMTFAYDHWENVGSRLPLIRGGVGHLYNCYTDGTPMKEARDAAYSLKNEKGEDIRTQIINAGGTYKFLFRGMNARNGASIAADTNVYYNMDEPMIGAENDAEEYAASDKTKAYANLFGYNHSLIVNSKVTDTKGNVQVGSSWDNNGDNLLANGYGWTDKSTIGNWSWGQEGEELSYEYQTFPLEDVEKNVKEYGGAYQLDMEASDWLRVEYPEDFALKAVDKSVEVPIEEIKLSKSEATLYIQEEFLQLDARVAPANTTESADDFKWESENTQVAEVRDSGLVIPKKLGVTTITVTTEKGLQASCKVTVGNLPRSVKITDVPEEIYVGDIFTLKASFEPEELLDDAVIWDSMGFNATVLDSKRGIFRADKAGSNAVMATMEEQGNRLKEKELGGQKTLKFLTTSVFVSDVSVDAQLEVKVGEQKKLNASAIPENATNPRLLYEVSDSSIAVIDENGNVTGCAAGETIVTVTSVNGGYQKQCLIKVSASGSVEPDAPDLKDVQKGDVNQDGIIDLDDVQTALRIYLELEENLSQTKIDAADVDGSKDVSLTDVQYILQYYLEIITSFEEVTK